MRRLTLFTVADFGRRLLTRTVAGTGGEITVTVCIDPADPNAAALETPVKNVVSVFNAFAPVTPNLEFGAGNNIPFTSFDFESVMLHEVGHCLGLGHPNVASESGLPDAEQDSTSAQVGTNTALDVNAGTDTLFGSSDDVRGDDVNLQWYEPGVNNPFLMPAKVDSSTYSRTGTLPAGHLFAVNADRQVGALLGIADTEAVMQQGTFNDEAQRELGVDDVATLMFAGTGYDEIAGTADDYTVKMEYVGLTTSCDIAVEPSTSGFAFCGVGLTSNVLNHWRVTSGTIEYNSTLTGWFFNWTSPASTLRWTGLTTSCYDTKSAEPSIWPMALQWARPVTSRWKPTTSFFRTVPALQTEAY